MQWLTGILGTGDLAAAPASGMLPQAQGFAPGTIVEYNSASQNAWIPAKVLTRHPDGTYDLDCKPAVPPDRVRPQTLGGPSQAAGHGTYAVGQIVEYFSASKGGWIPARVLGYDPAVGYNLDCKPGVQPDKIRPASFALGAAVGTATNLTMPGTQAAVPLQSIPERGAPMATMPGGAGALPPPVSFAPESRPTARSGTDAVPSFAALEAPTYRSRAVGSVARPKQEKPLQLVTCTRDQTGWHFEAQEEALRVLEAYGQTPVSICTVCGPYRSGKSYLLNLLLGRVQRGATQFAVGSTTKACTEGVWMWGSEETVRDGGALIYMDCEGFGSTDADKTKDAKMMSLCLLMSSVFLLNTKGVLNEGLFNALSLVSNLAEHIDDRGQEASKPALLWLLRDFVLDLEDPERPGHHLTPDEYLEKALSARPLIGNDAERSAAAREVRATLLKTFPRRHCCTLVQPIVEEEKLCNLAQVPYDDLRPAFKKEFEFLRSQLLSLARERPKTIGGRSVGGAALAALVRHLCDSLNKSKALNMNSAWHGVQHSACQALSEELKSQAVTQLRRIKGGEPLPSIGGAGGKRLPLADSELQSALKACRRAIKADFLNRAVGEEGIKMEYWKDLRDSLGVEERDLERTNEQLSTDALKPVVDNWAAWLGQEEGVLASDPRSEELALVLERGMASKASGRAVSEALHAARMARIKADGALSTLKAELELKNTKVQRPRTETAETGVLGERLPVDPKRDTSAPTTRLKSRKASSSAAIECALAGARELASAEGDVGKDARSLAEQLERLRKACEAAEASDAAAEGSEEDDDKAALELGEMRGKVALLQDQAKLNIQREKALRAQMMEAEENAREYKRQLEEEKVVNREGESKFKDMMEAFRTQGRELQRLKEEQPMSTSREPPKAEPKKCCTVM